MSSTIINAPPLQNRSAWILKRVNIRLLLAALWVIAMLVMASFAPWLPIQDPETLDLMSMSTTPNAAHWLGTDSLGRDMFARVIYGARISMLVGIGSVAIGLLIGGALGIVAGYFRGRLDSVIMAAMNVLLSFPSIILAIAIIGYLGASILNVIVAIGMVFIPAFARIARANTLIFRKREFVLVAQTLGASHVRIILLEILPNLIGALLSYSLVMFAVAILAEASLGFLGLSVPPPAPSWGSMISSERTNLETAPHTLLMPGLAMFFTVVALNILGDRAQKAFDIKEAAL